LTVSTILTLIIIPTIYAVFAASRVKHEHKVIKRAAKHHTLESHHS